MQVMQKQQNDDQHAHENEVHQQQQAHQTPRQRRKLRNDMQKVHMANLNSNYKFEFRQYHQTTNAK